MKKGPELDVNVILFYMNDDGGINKEKLGIGKDAKFESKKLMGGVEYIVTPQIPADKIEAVRQMLIQEMNLSNEEGNKIERKAGSGNPRVFIPMDIAHKFVEDMKQKQKEREKGIVDLSNIRIKSETVDSAIKSDETQRELSTKQPTSAKADKRQRAVVVDGLNYPRELKSRAPETRGSKQRAENVKQRKPDVILKELEQPKPKKPKKLT